MRARTFVYRRPARRPQRRPWIGTSAAVVAAGTSFVAARRAIYWPAYRRRSPAALVAYMPRPSFPWSVTAPVVVVVERPAGSLLFGRRPQVLPLYDHALMLSPGPAGVFVRGLQRTRQAVERRGRS